MKRGELMWDELIPWIIAVGVLVVVGGIYFIATGKGQAIIDYLNNLFRFGR